VIESNCALCGSAERSLLVTGHDRDFPQNTRTYTLYSCARCGLVYLSPRPDTPEEMAEIYPQEYDSYMKEGQGLLMALRRMAWRPELREILGRSRPEGRILEVGSATGEFLAELRRVGRPHLVGLEFSEQAAAVARRRHGLDVRAGELIGAQLPAGSFDVVLMRHVLEHVADPRATLCEIARVLRPGGRCIFTIPSIDSYTAQMFGADWYGYQVPRHFHLFPQRTLMALLSAAGLRCERLVHVATPNIWIGSTRFWLAARGWPGLARLVRYENPLALALFLPLGLLSAALRSGGTIRVIARRDT
jgi:SAM-dependent methyltransferase